MKWFLTITLSSIGIRLLLGPLNRVSVNFPTPKFATRNKKSLSNEELVAFLSQLRQLLASGLPTSMALVTTAKSFQKDLFPEVRSHQDRLAEVPEAFASDVLNFKCDTLQKLVKLLSINRELGASISPSVDLLISNVLERQANEEMLAGEIAGVKATVFVLATLPLFGIALGFVMGINIPYWLATNHIGQLCLILALALESLGIYWSQQLIRI